MRVLLVEDDRALGSQVEGQLREAGFEPVWVQDGPAAARWAGEPLDLVVLDLMLPGMDGLDVLRRLREASDVPILVLSGRRDTAVRVRALELGADDYLTKPFWPDELLARIAARLRRPHLTRGRLLELGPVHLDLERRELHVEGREVELTPVEYELLAYLARRLERAVSREDLAEAVLDPGREGLSRGLDSHVSRLRRKLGPGAPHLRTVWGVGYRLSREAPR